MEAKVLSFHRAMVEHLPGSKSMVAEDGSRDKTPKLNKMSRQ
jgi:hypothetical protein